MKKIFFNSLLLMLSVSVTLSSCLKDDGYEQGLYGSVRNTEGGRYVSIGLGGLQNFSKSSILIDTQKDSAFTVDVTVSLDYEQKTTDPQLVKIAIDNSKITSYNAANGRNFQPVTAEMVKLAATDLTIPAGAGFVTTKMTINQSKFDPAKSYLIPITIMDAPGAALSSNLNTRYYNIIGNPYAGAYKHDFTRFNNQTGTGAPNALSYTAKARIALPISETVFSIPSGYYIEPNYNVTAKPDGTFAVVLNAGDVKTMKDNGVNVIEGPVIMKADPVTKEFIFRYVVEASGAYRYIIDRYYKP